ncbi:MAG: hypothetical protein ACK2UC_14670 [Anaerolineae bacterium]|jgi:hypothetical protein
MGLARFVAQDPYRPRATKEELDGLLDRIDGVLDWTIHDNGDVTVEYDSSRLYEGLIEDALSGSGFKLHHIIDEPDASEAEAEGALGY